MGIENWLDEVIWYGMAWRGVVVIVYSEWQSHSTGLRPDHRCVELTVTKLHTLLVVIFHGCWCPQGVDRCRAVMGKT